MFEWLTTGKSSEIGVLRVDSIPPRAMADTGDRALDRAPGALKSLVALFAVQDIVLIVYLMIVSALLLRTGSGPAQVLHARQSFVGVMAMVLGCFFARGVTFVPPVIRLAAYRILVVGMVVVNYLSLRNVLPIIRSDTVDAELWRIDLLLFGVEPALWLERFNTRPVIEWFSFFYFSYFWLCFAYMVVGMWLLRPGRRSTEFAIGTALVYCVGQLGYMAVPGCGPVVALRDQFQAPLDGGFFWGCVNHLVNAGGAQKDIFPSLHTAGPVWFTLFAWRAAREDRRFRWPAIVTGFFAFNIIISTMLLRWHYAIDVVAGLTLAVGAAILTPRLVRWEESLRRDAGARSAWSFA